MKKTIGLAALTLVLFGTAYGFYKYNQPREGVSDKKPNYSINATSLVEEYDNDENAANAKYLGKVVEVRGVVSEKVKNDQGKYNITLLAADLTGVGCEFDPAWQDKVKYLQEGQEVRIKGICTGVLMDVVLVDCVYINPDTNY